jgi:hypothetical protein
MENTQNSQAGAGAGNGVDGSSAGQQGSLTGVTDVGSSAVGGPNTSGETNGAGSGPGAGPLSSGDLDSKKNPPRPPAEPVKGRVLRDGEYGKVNDVVTLTDAEAKRARKSGDVDTADAAVAYAESLKAAG